MSDKIFIHFLGAAGTVTGSKYLVEGAGKKILVDCGMFQGLKELRLLNWERLPVDASDIDFVLLTHGHLDHVGYLPCLIKNGFKGKIFGTAPTLDIAKIILNDSAKIQEEEAEQANKDGYSSHRPAKPLYNLKDVERTIPHFSEVKAGEWIELAGTLTMRFQTNGHILGSAFIEIHLNEKKLVFSGDLGQENDLLLPPPKRPLEADVLLIESTYGDRLHPHEDVMEYLRNVVLSTVRKGGSLIIPSFAVERTQTMMYMLWQLRKANAIPEIPMILDSPMGANILGIFEKYKSWQKLPASDYADMRNFFTIVTEFKETLSIAATKYPKIIIAGSGMVTGGRVLTYLQSYLGNFENTILLVGYQAEGTRGRKLQEGTHELKIYGNYYPVKARVEIINGLSAHGDQKDLLDWLREIKGRPEHIYIVHGEKQAAETLQVKIKDTYGWLASVPDLYDIVDI